MADHCANHALSDPKNPLLRKTCNHNHDLTCQHCELVKDLLEEAKEQAESEEMEKEKNGEGKLYHMAVAAQAEENIIKFKQHQLRTVAQDMAKKEILPNMRSSEFYVTMDWAMKWVPMEGRESSRSWFGKRGISWHISVVMAQSPHRILVNQGPRSQPKPTKFFQRTYVHIFQQSSQRAVDVHAILRHLCMNLKEEFPPLEKLFIQSDKASCYHNTILFGSLRTISEDCGVEIARWDFTEPQSGKSVCDRQAARLKNHVNKYINEKKSCRTSTELAQCIASHDGIDGVHTFVGEVEGSEDSPSMTIPGITQFNNFKTESDGIRMWRSYDIGDGILKKHSIWEDGNSYYTSSFLQSKHYIQNIEMESMADVLRRKENSGDPNAWKLWWTPFFVRDDGKGEEEEWGTRFDEGEKVHWNAFIRSEINEHEEVASRDSKVRRRRHWRHHRQLVQRRHRRNPATMEAEHRINMAEVRDRTKPAPLLFNCPEPGCRAKFFYRKWLDHHLDLGMHDYEPDRWTLRDFSLKLYKQHLERQSVRLIPISTLTEKDFIEYTSKHELPGQGWGINNPRKRTPLSQAVKDKLNDAFWEGKRTKQKPDAGELAKKLRKELQPSEWVRDATILSYFSRKTAAERKARALDSVLEEATETVVERRNEDAPVELNMEHLDQLEPDVEEATRLHENFLRHKVRQEFDNQPI